VRAIAGTKTRIEKSIIPAGSSSFIQRLSYPVNLRHSNFSCFVGGKFVSDHIPLDKNNNPVAADLIGAAANAPVICSARFLFDPPTAVDQELAIVYHSFSGDWIDQRELDQRIKSSVELLLANGSLADDLLSQIEAMIDSAVSAMKDSLEADLQSFVESGIDSLGIPSMISSAVDSAIEAAGIPGAISSAIAGIGKTFCVSLDASADPPQCAFALPDGISSLWIENCESDGFDNENLSLFIDAMGGGALEEVSKNPALPTDVSSFERIVKFTAEGAGSDPTFVVFGLKAL
jgi:hypothetical protein